MPSPGETPLAQCRRLIGEMREQQDRLRKALEPIHELGAKELVNEEEADAIERRLLGEQSEQ